MKNLLLIFLTITVTFLLLSSKWDVKDEYSLYSCGTSRFPNGGPGPFMDCSTVNPLVDVMCAGCHGQNAQMDGNGNIISYSNIVDGTDMNVFKVLDGSTQVTEYIPGQEYTIELNMNSLFIRKGFDVTICASTGDYGIFTEIVTEPGVQVISGPSFIYATHTDNTGTDLWRWKWTAPSVDPGPITFDILTLKNNNDGNDSLYISEIIFNPAPVGIGSQIAIINNLTIWTENNSHKLVLQFHDKVDLPIGIEIFNSSGARILTDMIHELNGLKAELDLPVNKNSGVYMIRLTNSQGQSMNKRIYIP